MVLQFCPRRTMVVHGFGKAETTDRNRPWAPLFMKIICLIVCLLLIGCSKDPISPVSNFRAEQSVVTDIIGHKYICVSNQVVLSNGMVQVALWKKIEPLDNERWYTPTLASTLNTNNPPTFNPILR